MKLQSMFWRTESISLWNVGVALFIPKGIRKNSHRPKGVMTAVLGMSFGATGI